MRKIKLLFLVIVLAVIAAPHPVWAKKHHSQKRPLLHHGALVDGTAAYADIIMDAETGQILHQTDPDGLRHPASLTKMMTLYLTFQALEKGDLGINQYLPISSNASEQSPSKLGLRPGQRIRVEDAILGLVTESANDAAVVLGEWLGGSEEDFGQLMTRQAHALGMLHTQFKNPSGLPDPDQITTAHDMAILGHALIYHFPQFYPYFSHDHFVYQGLDHHTHNHLMDRYDGMDGIKTGYIRASGFNLVASAKRGNTRIIGVVFGGHSAIARDNLMAELLDDAFDRDQKGQPSQPLHLAKAVPPSTFAQGDSSDNEDGTDGYTVLPPKTASPPAPTPIQPASAPPVSAPAPTPTPASAPPPAPIVKNNAAKTEAPLPAPVKQEEVSKPKIVDKNNNWGIQIGAYSDPDIGRQAVASVVNAMPKLLGTGEPQIQKVVVSGTSMYRARLMSLDQKTAQGVCSYLVQHGQGCLTVGP